MNHFFTLFFLLLLLFTNPIHSFSQNRVGNPIFSGYYADPEGIKFDSTFWIFPTVSDNFDTSHHQFMTEEQIMLRKNAINAQYLQQTYLDAFSSDDLNHWQKHEKVLSINSITWAAYSIWAPSILSANDKYYLFFSANDIQNNDEVGGIGVAVADQPEGPYKDAIGKPLINQFYNEAQPIDQFVFQDDDGQFYMYYGGWRHCNVVKLSKNLTELIPF